MICRSYIKHIVRRNIVIKDGSTNKTPHVLLDSKMALLAENNYAIRSLLFRFSPISSVYCKSKIRHDN